MTQNYISNIWKIYLFRFISSIELTVAVYALFLMANGLSVTQIMFLEIFYLVFVIFLEVPSGAFADINGRKLSMGLGMVFQSLSFVIFGFGTNFLHFLIGSISFSVGMSLLSGADSAFIYDSLKEHSREKEYPKILGMFFFIGLLVLGLSSPLSTYLGSSMGYRPVFFLTALFFFLGFVITLFFKEPPVHKHLLESNYLRHLVSSFSFVYRNRVLFNLMIYYGVFASMSYVTWLIIQPYYAFSDEPAFYLGVALFFYFIMAGVGNIIAHKTLQKTSLQNKLLLILFVAGISFVMMFFVDVILALIFVILMSLASGLREVFVNDEVNKRTPSHQRATVLSIMSVSRSVIYALLAPILGLATDLFSARVAFLIMGSVLLIYFLIIILLKSSVRNKIL